MVGTPSYLAVLCDTYHRQSGNPSTIRESIQASGVRKAHYV